MHCRLVCRYLRQYIIDVSILYLRCSCVVSTCVLGLIAFGRFNSLFEMHETLKPFILRVDCSFNSLFEMHI